MTRKDYILIAGALQTARVKAENKPGVLPKSWEVPMNFDAEHVADALATDNPRFDREHFLSVVRGQKDLNSRPARKG